LAGIVGYGASVPYARVRIDDIYAAWENVSNLEKLKNSTQVSERAVLQPDEDTITLSVAATRAALANSGVGRENVDALFLGTCTSPYDTKPSAAVVSEAIGSSHLMSGDVQFSGKSGTTVMQICMALVDSGMARNALAIGADTINRHTCPGRVYEYTASAGAVAFVVGKKGSIAEVAGTSSYATDTTDFFRVAGDRYIHDVGYYYGRPYPMWTVGFEEHVVEASTSLLQKLHLKPEDYSYAVFQQPYGWVPSAIGERLGFSKKQIEAGVIAPMIGDCGAASALLGLVNVLDVAKAGERIFMAAYGWGAGSDAFSFDVAASIESARPKNSLAKDLSRKKVVDYATACRFEYKYMQDLHPLYR
jgi:3-hydroxy-3-methylglutaryl CoA synthase